MNTKDIEYRINQLPNSLVLVNNKIANRSYDIIYEFLNQNSLVSKLEMKRSIKPNMIPYHQSIFHFLLYYAHTPKIPFIFKFDEQIIFASIHKKNEITLEMSFPEIIKSLKATKVIETLLGDEKVKSFLEDINISTILFRDIPDGVVQLLRSSGKLGVFRIGSIKEINYQIYDVKRTLKHIGKQFANLRWHLNKFKKDKHSIKSVPLHENKKAVIHLIGSWKKMALEQRGFSFINVQSDKQATELFDSSKQKRKNEENLLPQVSDGLSRVLKIDGQIRSFQFGFPLGIFKKQNVLAHAIGITDLSIPHLAEYAQYDFWMQIHKQGYEYVNDGPSWKSSLEIFKQKFRPIAKKRTYYISLKQ